MQTVFNLKILSAVGVAIALAVAPLNAALAQERGPVSVSDLASELSDAVVNIGTSRLVPGGRGVPFPEVPEGSPLEDLFDDLNPNSGQGDERMREARSLGSGFIIAADGIIVTNNHVIEGADEVLVFLTDGSRHEATILGADEKTDLAVLKIDAGRDLTYVEFGNSDTAEVGDWVMAIGNPFGLGGSVTLGIVSARNRDINSGPYDNFIQTDAAINQGNSGGPLFDMNGDVVGVNTAIISRTGGGLGIGFAVPGNLAKNVVGQLAEFGETRRGWLGVGIQGVSDDIAASLGREDNEGALVIEVTEPGPSSGIIRSGDLILEFDGKPIVRMRDLPRIVAETSVGKSVKVRVLRGGAEEELDIELGRLEASEQLVASLDATDDAAEPEPPVAVELSLVELVGLETGVLDDASRDELNIDDGVDGVLITDVVAGSDAEDKGLRVGLVIEEVNQQSISTVEEVAALVGEAREAGRPAVLFKVADPTGVRRFVAVKLE